MAATAPSDAACPVVCDDGPTRTFGLLLEAHARLTRLLEAELQASDGISLQTFEVLLRLGRAPQGQLTMTELADAVALTTGGITRLADRLERDGLAHRAACPTDRRRVHLVLTDHGRSTLEAAFAHHVEALERHVQGRLDRRAEACLQDALDLLRSEPEPAG